MYSTILQLCKKEKKKKSNMLSSAFLVVLINLSVRQQCLLWVKLCGKTLQLKILVRMHPKPLPSIFFLKGMEIKKKPKKQNLLPHHKLISNEK